MKMKKPLLFWLLVTILLGSCIEQRVCSPSNPEFCDKSCERDEDCKYECGCGCISKDETCFSNLVCKLHLCSECYCKDGKCESWLSLFNEAIKKRNASLCVKIKPPSCRDLCYEYLGGLVEIRTDKTEYEQGEKVKITVLNKLEEPIYYVTFCGYSPFEVFRKTEKGWEKLEQIRMPVVCEQAFEILELKPNVVWEALMSTQYILRDSNKSFLEVPGVYKIGFKYSLIPPNESYDYEEYLKIFEKTARWAYSNEFEVKPEIQILSPEKYVFLELWTHRSGEVIEGRCMGPRIDHPTYYFNEKEGILGGAIDFEINESLKIIYGRGIDLSGAAGGGAASKLSGIYRLPYTDEVENLTIKELGDDGTLTLIYQGKEITLKAKESWKTTKVEIANWEICKVKLITKIEIKNYGILDKEKIKGH